MLQNEKYAGNCISQKTYTTDFLTHKRAKNNGELAKYIIENNHEPIISKEIFIEAQKRIVEIGLKWSKKRGKKSSGSQYELSNLLVCGKCGSPMRRKSWKNRKGQKEVWYACKERLSKGKSCRNDYVLDVQIQKGIMEAIMEFKEEETISSYDEKRVRSYVERIVVRNKKLIDIYFKGGFTVTKTL